MDNAAQPSPCMQAHRAAEGERSQDEPGEDPLEDGASVPHTGRGAGGFWGPVHSRHAAGGQEGGELVLRQGAAFKTAVLYTHFLFYFIFLIPAAVNLLPFPPPTVCRSPRCWRRLRESGSAALSPQRSLSSAWGWDRRTPGMTRQGFLFFF